MSIKSDVSKSYQIGSQGFNNLTTQSSLYGMQNSVSISVDNKLDKSNEMNRDRSPLQAVVRIRGKHN